jgi:L-lactate dehydrogenase complex protein LldE
VRVALFVPCFVDQLAPAVAEATWTVLERAGCTVSYDPDQTCCGQPLLTVGAGEEAARVAEAQLARFEGAEAVVCPSASCVATVRHRYPELDVAVSGPQAQTRGRVFELCEFLASELEQVELGARFPHRVALLESCHGLRDLGLGRASELGPGDATGPGPVERLLRAVDGLELARPERDECCGFGGAFSVRYPEVSTRMGVDRLDALARTGAEYVTGTDTSCLLHLDGLRRRGSRGPRSLHVAEILAARD